MKRLQFEKIENNKKILCEVIATYHEDSNNKDYVVYTDNNITNNKLNIYYSLYKLVNNNIVLIDTKDIEDKKIGLELIKELIKEIN